MHGCSHDLPLHPRIHPPFLWFVKVSPDPRIYPSLPEYTPPFQQIYIKCATLQEFTPPSQNIPPFFNSYMQPSENLPLPPRIYPPFSTNLYVRPSQNLPIPFRIKPPFQPICMCDTPRIISCWKGGGGIFWEGGVYSGSVAYSCWKGGYILGGRGRFWEPYTLYIITIKGGG